MLGVACGEEPLRQRLELRRIVIQTVFEDGQASAQNEKRLGRILRRPKLERLPVELRRLGVGAEQERSVGGFSERGPRVLAEIVCLHAGRGRELECRQIVIRQHLCAVVRPVGGQRLDPLCDNTVLLGT